MPPFVKIILGLLSHWDVLSAFVFVTAMAIATLHGDSYDVTRNERGELTFKLRNRNDSPSLPPGE